MRTKSPLARRTGLWPSTASQHSPISTSPKPAKSIRERRTAQRPAPWITFVPAARGRSKVITSASGSMFRTIYNALWTPYYSLYGLACARFLATVRSGDFMRKIAFITGASSGIGGATAVALAERGVDSIVTFNSHEDRVRDVVEAVRQRGAKAVPVRLDVGESARFV